MDIKQHVSVNLCIITCNKIRILKFSYEENINQVPIWKNNNNKTLKISKQDQKNKNKKRAIMGFQSPVYTDF